MFNRAKSASQEEKRRQAAAICRKISRHFDEMATRFESLQRRVDLNQVIKDLAKTESTFANVKRNLR